MSCSPHDKISIESSPPQLARNRDITPNHPPTGYLSAICDGAQIFASISARHTPEQQSVSQAWTPYGRYTLHTLHAHWQEKFKNVLKCCFQSSQFCAATSQ